MGMVVGLILLMNYKVGVNNNKFMIPLFCVICSSAFLKLEEVNEYLN